MTEIIPVIPKDLVEVLKDLAKNVLRDNPDNLYLYASQYFEKRIIERDGSLYKEYEIFEKNDKYFSKGTEKYIFYKGSPKEKQNSFTKSSNKTLNNNTLNKTAVVQPRIINGDINATHKHHHGQNITAKLKTNTYLAEGKCDVTDSFPNNDRAQYNNKTENSLKNETINEKYNSERRKSIDKNIMGSLRSNKISVLSSNAQSLSSLDLNTDTPAYQTKPSYIQEKPVEIVSHPEQSQGNADLPGEYMSNNDKNESVHINMDPTKNSEFTSENNHVVNSLHHKQKYEAKTIYGHDIKDKISNLNKDSHDLQLNQNIVTANLFTPNEEEIVNKVGGSQKTNEPNGSFDLTYPNNKTLNENHGRNENEAISEHGKTETNADLLAKISGDWQYTSNINKAVDIPISMDLTKESSEITTASNNIVDSGTHFKKNAPKTIYKYDTEEQNSELITNSPNLQLNKRVANSKLNTAIANQVTNKIEESPEANARHNLINVNTTDGKSFCNLVNNDDHSQSDVLEPVDKLEKTAENNRNDRDETKSDNTANLDIVTQNIVLSVQHNRKNVPGTISVHIKEKNANLFENSNHLEENQSHGNNNLLTSTEVQITNKLAESEKPTEPNVACDLLNANTTNQKGFENLVDNDDSKHGDVCESINEENVTEKKSEILVEVPDLTLDKHIVNDDLVLDIENQMIKSISDLKQSKNNTVDESESDNQIEKATDINSSVEKMNNSDIITESNNIVSTFYHDQENVPETISVHIQDNTNKANVIENSNDLKVNKTGANTKLLTPKEVQITNKLAESEKTTEPNVACDLLNANTTNQKGFENLVDNDDSKHGDVCESINEENVTEKKSEILVKVPDLTLDKHIVNDDLVLDIENQMIKSISDLKQSKNNKVDESESDNQIEKATDINSSVEKMNNSDIITESNNIVSTFYHDQENVPETISVHIQDNTNKANVIENSNDLKVNKTGANTKLLTPKEVQITNKLAESEKTTEPNVACDLLNANTTNQKGFENLVDNDDSKHGDVCESINEENVTEKKSEILVKVPDLTLDKHIINDDLVLDIENQMSKSISDLKQSKNNTVDESESDNQIEKATDINSSVEKMNNSDIITESNNIVSTFYHDQENVPETISVHIQDNTNKANVIENSNDLKVNKTGANTKLLTPKEVKITNKLAESKKTAEPNVAGDLLYTNKINQKGFDNLVNNDDNKHGDVSESINEENMTETNSEILAKVPDLPLDKHIVNDDLVLDIENQMIKSISNLKQPKNNIFDESKSDNQIEKVTDINSSIEKTNKNSDIITESNSIVSTFYHDHENVPETISVQILDNTKKANVIENSNDLAVNKTGANAKLLTSKEFLITNKLADSKKTAEPNVAGDFLYANTINQKGFDNLVDNDDSKHRDVSESINEQNVTETNSEILVKVPDLPLDKHIVNNDLVLDIENQMINSISDLKQSKNNTIDESESDHQIEKATDINSSIEKTNNSDIITESNKNVPETTSVHIQDNTKNANVIENSNDLEVNKTGANTKLFTSKGIQNTNKLAESKKTAEPNVACDLLYANTINQKGFDNLVDNDDNKHGDVSESINEENMTETNSEILAKVPDLPLDKHIVNDDLVLDIENQMIKSISNLKQSKKNTVDESKSDNQIEKATDINSSMENTNNSNIITESNNIVSTFYHDPENVSETTSVHILDNTKNANVIENSNELEVNKTGANTKLFTSKAVQNTNKLAESKKTAEPNAACDLLYANTNNQKGFDNLVDNDDSKHRDVSESINEENMTETNSEVLAKVTDLPLDKHIVNDDLVLDIENQMIKSISNLKQSKNNTVDESKSDNQIEKATDINSSMEKTNNSNIITESNNIVPETTSVHILDNTKNANVIENSNELEVNKTGANTKLFTSKGVQNTNKLAESKKTAEPNVGCDLLYANTNNQKGFDNLVDNDDSKHRDVSQSNNEENVTETNSGVLVKVTDLPLDDHIENDDLVLHIQNQMVKTRSNLEQLETNKVDESKTDSKIKQPTDVNTSIEKTNKNSDIVIESNNIVNSLYHNTEHVPQTISVHIKEKNENLLENSQDCEVKMRTNASCNLLTSKEVQITNELGESQKTAAPNVAGDLMNANTTNLNEFANLIDKDDSKQNDGSETITEDNMTETHSEVLVKVPDLPLDMHIQNDNLVLDIQKQMIKSISNLEQSKSNDESKPDNQINKRIDINSSIEKKNENSNSVIGSNNIESSFHHDPEYVPETISFYIQDNTENANIIENSNDLEVNKTDASNKLLTPKEVQIRNKLDESNETAEPNVACDFLYANTNNQKGFKNLVDNDDSKDRDLCESINEQNVTEANSEILVKVPDLTLDKHIVNDDLVLDIENQMINSISDLKQSKNNTVDESESDNQIEKATDINSSIEKTNNSDIITESNNIMSTFYHDQENVPETISVHIQDNTKNANVIENSNDLEVNKTGANTKLFTSKGIQNTNKLAESKKTVEPNVACDLLYANTINQKGFDNLVDNDDNKHGDVSESINEENMTETNSEILAKVPDLPLDKHIVNDDLVLDIENQMIKSISNLKQPKNNIVDESKSDNQIEKVTDINSSIEKTNKNSDIITESNSIVSTFYHDHENVPETISVQILDNTKKANVIENSNDLEVIKTGANAKLLTSKEFQITNKHAESKKTAEPNVAGDLLYANTINQKEFDNLMDNDDSKDRDVSESINEENMTETNSEILAKVPDLPLDKHIVNDDLVLDIQHQMVKSISNLEQLKRNAVDESKSDNHIKKPTDINTSVEETNKNLGILNESSTIVNSFHHDPEHVPETIAVHIKEKNANFFENSHNLEENKTDGSSNLFTSNEVQFNNFGVSQKTGELNIASELMNANIKNLKEFANLVYNDDSKQSDGSETINEKTMIEPNSEVLVIVPELHSDKPIEKKDDLVLDIQKQMVKSTSNIEQLTSNEVDESKSDSQIKQPKEINTCIEKTDKNSGIANESNNIVNSFPHDPEHVPETISVNIKEKNANLFENSHGSHINKTDAIRNLLISKAQINNLGEPQKAAEPNVSPDLMNANVKNLKGFANLVDNDDSKQRDISATINQEIMPETNSEVLVKVPDLPLYNNIENEDLFLHTQIQMVKCTSNPEQLKSSVVDESKSDYQIKKCTDIVTGSNRTVSSFNQHAQHVPEIISVHIKEENANLFENCNDLEVNKTDGNDNLLTSKDVNSTNKVRESQSTTELNIACNLMNANTNNLKGFANLVKNNGNKQEDVSESINQEIMTETNSEILVKVKDLPLGKYIENDDLGLDMQKKMIMNISNPKQSKNNVVNESIFINQINNATDTNSSMVQTNKSSDIVTGDNNIVSTFQHELEIVRNISNLEQSKSNVVTESMSNNHINKSTNRNIGMDISENLGIVAKNKNIVYSVSQKHVPETIYELKQKKFYVIDNSNVHDLINANAKNVNSELVDERIMSKTNSEMFTNVACESENHIQESINDNNKIELIITKATIGNCSKSLSNRTPFSKLKLRDSNRDLDMEYICNFDQNCNDENIPIDCTNINIHLNTNEILGKIYIQNYGYIPVKVYKNDTKNKFYKILPKFEDFLPDKNIEYDKLISNKDIKPLSVLDSEDSHIWHNMGENMFDNNSFINLKNRCTKNTYNENLVNTNATNQTDCNSRISVIPFFDELCNGNNSKYIYNEVKQESAHDNQNEIQKCEDHILIDLTQNRTYHTSQQKNNTKGNSTNKILAENCSIGLHKVITFHWNNTSTLICPPIIIYEKIIGNYLFFKPFIIWKNKYISGTILPALRKKTTYNHINSITPISQLLVFNPKENLGEEFYLKLQINNINETEDINLTVINNGRVIKFSKQQYHDNSSETQNSKKVEIFTI